MLQTSADAERTIGTLREMGIRIALDDFGTGFSSLSHISKLHFDTIKIDRSFVTDAAERAASAAIVRAVAYIAGELSIGTVAEGVETVEQLEWIRDAGCREAQGYLFSRPVPLAAATAMIEDEIGGQRPGFARVQESEYADVSDADAWARDPRA